MTDIALPLSTETAEAVESWTDLIQAVINGGGVVPVFQPIVDLRHGRVVGFEALARFTKGPAVAPNLWFAEAARRGLLAEFDAAVLRSQLAIRSALPPDTFLSVNVEPESLLDERVINVFLEHSPLDGIVVEVTEHRGLGDPVRIRDAIDQLKRRGALIAVDDAGAGYAGLQQILIIEPQILKLDRSLIEGIDSDETKASLVEMLGVFAGRIGATVLAEGIETASEARATAELGVELAQGYYFARPAPPWVGMEDEVIDSIIDHNSDRTDSFTLRPVLSAHPSMEASGESPCCGGSICAGGFNARRTSPVVVTRNAKPIGVLYPGMTEPTRVLVAQLSTTPAELANRIATGAPDKA
ncbi:MAG: EAL domain-containing protein, partial [Microthrixaceae bacterium]|nr:EAL domain-containing protein [Microthrixaceae bacterium]